jgi:hypothetical protein
LKSDPKKEMAAALEALLHTHFDDDAIEFSPDLGLLRGEIARLLAQGSQAALLRIELADVALQ